MEIKVENNLRKQWWRMLPLEKKKSKQSEIFFYFYFVGIILLLLLSAMSLHGVGDHGSPQLPFVGRSNFLLFTIRPHKIVRERIHFSSFPLAFIEIFVSQEFQLSYFNDVLF